MVRLRGNGNLILPRRYDDGGGHGTMETKDREKERERESPSTASSTL